eukprot:scaffold393_cov158-Skeletonema_dohrnii-CCMP3373.AAC.1
MGILDTFSLLAPFSNSYSIISVRELKIECSEVLSSLQKLLTRKAVKAESESEFSAIETEESITERISLREGEAEGEQQSKSSAPWHWHCLL